MPTIGVDKYRLFEELGETFTADTFQQLCFDFGIELDEDTEEDADRPKDEPPQLKIEIPANRVSSRARVPSPPDVVLTAAGA